MKTFLLKHIWFNNQKSNNYFLPEIHLPVVFSHFLYQVHKKSRNISSRKKRIYPKSTPDILKVISFATTPVYYIITFIATARNNPLFRIAILK